MFWSFLAVFFSGWLYVDASYRGPKWQRWLFKPLTLLLLLGLAWQAPLLTTTGYLILSGLLASLIGDTLLLLPQQRMLYALGAFFLSHLLYTLCFTSDMTLTFIWPVPVTLLIVGGVVIASIWPRLEDLRWPVCTLTGMTLVMVWLTAEQYWLERTEYRFSLLAGSLFLLLAYIIWFFRQYRRRFKADRAISAACYFVGHFMMVRALYL